MVIRMKGKSKTKNQLIDELSALHKKIAVLEESIVQRSLTGEHYRLLYEESIDGYTAVNLEGYFQECNSAFMKMVGYTAGELRGMTFLDLTPAKWHDMEKAVIREQFSTGNYSQIYEKEYKHKNGDIFPVELRTYLIKNPNGQTTGMWALVHDITARKRAEETLQKREEKYRLLIENSHDIIYILTPEGIFTFVSPGWPALLGQEVNQVVGKPFQQFVHPDDIGECEIFLKKMVETEQRQTDIEYRVRHIDGSWHWYISNAVPLKDKAGMVIGYEGIARDITDRKQVEESLRSSEIKFRTLYDSTSDAIILLNRDGLFDCNKAAVAMFGCTRDELLSKKIADLSPPKQFGGKDSYTLGGEMITAALKNGSVDFEWIHKRFDTDEHFPSEVLFTVMELNGKAFIQAVIRNITARKQAEEALKESEIVYKAIFENTGTATVIMEEDETISLANTECERLSGYTRKEIEGKKKWTEFVVKDDLEMMTAQHKLRRIDADAAQKSYESRIVDKGGRIKNIHFNVDLIPGTKKSVASLLDITERKQAEEALKESQQQFSDIINFLPDATFVIDKVGKVIFWNLAMEEMTGIKAADMLGRDNYEYALPFYGERRPLLADLVLNPRKDIEDKYSRTDRENMFLEAEVYIPYFRGREIYLFGKASILRDSRGNIVGAIESIRDVTLKKQSEEALKHSEERFSKAFHISPLPIVITTVNDGRYIDVNDSYLRMMGYTREEVIGHTANELSIWADFNNRRNVVKKLAKQSFLRNEVFKFLTKTGETRDALVSAETIVLNGNNFLLFICYDITDQEKLESQLRQAQKMEAIGTLAGGIAHDFNNILGAVMGYTEIALGYTNVDDHISRYLTQILKASERARDLVKQILTFSRKSDEKLIPMRVSPVIKEALKLLRASLPTTIKISQNIQSNPDTVFADPSQIHQILMNLGTNAAYALREKKGEIAVSLVSEEIKIGNTCGLVPGMYLKLTVGDTGAGIDSTIMGRIFDPFFTTKKPGEGTGLGLSVVYGIVKSYDGAVTVQSEPGKRTEFSIFLPLFTGAGDNQEAEADEFIAGGRERILFVDDEEMLVELGKSILNNMGYDVVGRTSSPEALELFRACPERFDLVVTDMTMPHMTGIELAKKLMQIKPGIPVIICTGFSETVTQEGVKSVGVKDLIMKPFNRRRIAESIRGALDKENSRDLWENS